MVVVDINDKSFFYDVMSLVLEFFPGEVVREKPVDHNENGSDLFINVSVLEKEAAVSVKDHLERENTEGFARREVKSAVKRALYRILSEITQKKLPWGTLSGIRPVKLISSYLEKGLLSGSIEKLLFDEYYISKEKAEKGLLIASLEV